MVTIFALEKNSMMISNLLQTTLGRLRIVAFLEGISFLVLLGIAMPLKYMASYPGPVRVVGMIHGVLFIGYVIFLVLTYFELRWSFWKAVLAFVASLVPFGTFYADKKLFRE
jgi:integral membrane protein